LQRLEPRHRGHRIGEGRQILHHLGLTLAQHLEAGGKELRHDGLRLRRIAAHQIGQHIGGQDVFAPAFVLGNDLQQILPGQIVSGLQIDDLHLTATADESGDILQRDVIAGFSVVEPAAGVTLDQQGRCLVELGHGLLRRCICSMMEKQSRNCKENRRKAAKPLRHPESGARADAATR
jgi:hypothetical protein